MRISIQQLGLAAYINMKGGQLLGMEGRKFQFESEKSEQQWRAEYAGSSEMRHDSLVCEMRNLLKQPTSA